METYLQPQDDGLPARESHPHVVEKLDYLKRYIDIFETAMRGKWSRRNYIDLFAGPGKCHIEGTESFHLGSPLLALTTRYPFTNCYFVDCDPLNIEILEKRCRASPFFDRIKFSAEDSNVVVSQIVDEIKEADAKRGANTWSSLNLAFLDPEGFELHWDTVGKLASLSKMDLIIYYPEMGLTRNIEQFVETYKDTPADSFFGDLAWREIYSKNILRGIGLVHRRLIQFYQQRLESIGYVEVKDLFISGNYVPQIRNTKGAPLYRLLFASKHPLGTSFWKKVMNINAYGQKSLFPS